MAGLQNNGFVFWIGFRFWILEMTMRCVELVGYIDGRGTGLELDIMIAAW